MKLIERFKERKAYNKDLLLKKALIEYSLDMLVSCAYNQDELDCLDRAIQALHKIKTISFFKSEEKAFIVSTLNLDALGVIAEVGRYFEEEGEKICKQ